MESHSTSNKNRKNLLIGLNKFGEIIQFNKECQKVTHYSRNDVIYRNILDFLIPTSHLNKWKEMVDSTLKKGEINNIEIPWKSSNGKEIPISWNSNIVGDKKKSNGDISFIGTVLNSDLISDELKEEQEDISEKSSIKNDKDKELKENKKRKDSKTKETENEKKFFRNKKSINKIEDRKTKIPKKLEKILEDLSHKYEKLSKKLNDLEISEKRIEKRLNEIDKYLPDGTILSDKKEETDLKFTEIDENNISDESANVTIQTYEPIDEHSGVMRINQDLDQKQEELEKFEASLIEDRKKLDNRIIELSRWKEKLLELESEIEKRRADLVEQESLFLQNLASNSDNKSNTDISITSDKQNLFSEDNINDFFDNISDCAVIIQRGTLKRVNQSFAELLGYEIDEMIDKSLFDFISPEGFRVIEKFYLDRLKGVESPGYDIVLLTKNKTEMPVQVSTQPTRYKGDKAEIAIFNIESFNKKETESEISSTQIESENNIIKEDNEDNESQQIQNSEQIDEETSKIIHETDTETDDKTDNTNEEDQENFDKNNENSSEESESKNEKSD